MNRGNKLSQRQKRFAELYVKTGNATQSYLEAGYKTNTAAASASSSLLLRNPKVKAYIEQLASELKKESIAEADEVMQFLTAVMRGNTTEQKGFATEDGVQVVDLDSDTSARIKAASEIMKRHPLPVEVNLNAPTAININFDFDQQDTPEPTEG